MFKKQLFKNILIKNTLILIICSLIIKALALVNRIILTRLLGSEGISLYIICIPTVMLFISLGGFSLNIALSKIISENEITKKYSRKQIFKSAILIGFFSSFISIILLLIIIKPLTNNLLKQPDAYYPILSTIFFIPLVTINNIFRGYYNGLNKINIGAIASLIEQISRIVISIILLIILLPYGLVISVTSSIIAMGIGELFSMIFSLINLKKYPFDNCESNNNPTKEILSISAPTMLSRLIGNFTYFLEPIVYTFALSKLLFSSDDIIYHYSEVNAYSIPLITMFSFISFAIGTVIIPNISKYHSLNDQQMLRYYTKKSILMPFIPGILITILISIFAKEYMLLLYDTDTGSQIVQNMSIFFILYYIQAPLISIMQAIGKSNVHFRISLITSIIKILSIIGLSFIPIISYNSLIISMLINVILTTMLYYFYIKNKLKFHFSLHNYLSIIIISIITSLFAIALTKFSSINYLLSTALITIFFIALAILLRITTVDDK